MRKTYSPEFKGKYVKEVFRGERLLSEIASEDNIYPNMLTRWKTGASNNLHVLFEMKMLKCEIRLSGMKHRLTKYTNRKTYCSARVDEKIGI